ncbi:MAG TPA: vitamin K epoxide reductase family protein [Nitrospira sp.]|nr:vitamin K epoxide reductase family protein [Nitrospira sp.]
MTSGTFQPARPSASTPRRPRFVLVPRRTAETGRSRGPRGLMWSWPDSVDPQAVRDDLRQARTGALRCRRGIVVLAVLGLGTGALMSLFQTGVIRHLPDPPIRRFHSDRVNASYAAYQYGVPAGPLSVALHATSLLLASAGGRGRATRPAWLPFAAAGKAAVEAGAAARYLFHRLPVVERSWCAYGIVDAVLRIGMFVLSLPEACEAARETFLEGRSTP